MPTAERWTALNPEDVEGNHEKSTVNTPNNPTKLRTLDTVL